MTAEDTPTPTTGSDDAGGGLRVIVVDDHPLVRTGIRLQLEETDPALHVVATAGDVEEAVAVIAAVPCDVVLLDVHLPGGHGGGGAEVVRRSPGVRFLALSVSDAAEDVVEVIRAGARGYVTKAIDAAGLVEAIRRVASGDAAFSPRLAGFVLDAFGTSWASAAPDDGELDRLSTRELDVMRLIARGYTYRETAGELYISIKTVETHVSAVLRKLQLSNRRELARWAAARRLV